MSPRALGRSGLKVSPLAFAGNVFGWSADAVTTRALLDECVALGLDLIDTADLYPAWAEGRRGGESETLIGHWLRSSGKRNRVVIAAKVARWPPRKRLSPANLQAACEDSLRRLQTDVIDLYQAHEDDPSVPLEDTLGAFSRLIEQGKVRAIGASNYTAPRLAEALAVAKRHNLPRFEALQPEYNLLDRAGYEATLEPLAREHGLGVIGDSSLASGFLSGKYRTGADAAKRRARGAQVATQHLNARGKRVLAALDDAGCRHAATLPQIALAWLIARPGMTAPIVSASSIAQLRELAAARTLLLTKSDIAALDGASAG